MNDPEAPPYFGSGVSPTLLLDATADEVKAAVDLMTPFSQRDPQAYYDDFRAEWKEQSRRLSVTARRLRDDFTPPPGTSLDWLRDGRLIPIPSPESRDFGPPVLAAEIFFYNFTRPCRLFVYYEHCPEFARQMIKGLLDIYGMGGAPETVKAGLRAETPETGKAEASAVMPATPEAGAAEASAEEQKPGRKHRPLPAWKKEKVDEWQRLQDEETMTQEDAATEVGEPRSTLRRWNDRMRGSNPLSS